MGKYDGGMFRRTHERHLRLLSQGYAAGKIGEKP